MKCKICESENEGTYYQAKEMFIGLRHTFRYWECDECKCVQLVDIPEDMSVYYPSDYYTSEVPGSFNFDGLDRSDEQAYIRRVLHSHALYHLKDVITSLDCRFLDVGCGSGILSIAAIRLGAAYALGIDIDSNALHSTHDNITLRRKEVLCMLG